MMNSEQFSCMKQVVKTVKLSLPFMYISNEIAGITAVLDSWKRQSVPQVEGIVVGYKNISLTSRIGTVSTQRSYAVYNVKATFDLFCPNIGDIVKGKINRISREHIGCLIKDTINVTIHLPREYPEELTKYIYLDGDILFAITHFVCKPKEIRVTGDVTAECIQLMSELMPAVEAPGVDDKSSSDEVSRVNLSILNSTKALNNESKKSKKRKRQSESSEELKVDILENNDQLPKKKKSKHLDLNLLDSIENSLNKKSKLLDLSMTNSTTKSPKKKSKSKLDSSLNDSNIGPPETKSKTKLDLSLTGSSTKSSKKKSKNKLDSSTIDTMISPKKELKRSDSTETIPNTTNFENLHHDNIVESIKREIISPEHQTPTAVDVNKKKRKRESTTADKKKKRKKKSKDGTKPSKSKDKKKPSKKKAKVTASGAVLKKDSKKKKGKSSNKNKKDKKKDKSEKKKHKKINLDIKVESNDIVKEIKSESD